MPFSEKTRLLEASGQDLRGADSLRNLFEKPASTAQLRPEEESSSFISGSGPASTTSSSTNKTWLRFILTTITGSVVFCVYHVVFCLAQAATITRPHAVVSRSTGALAKTAALGVVVSGPVFIANLGQDIPAIYPASDLFLAPFLAQIAERIDAVLYENGLENKDELFLTTFVVVTAGCGLTLSGLLCIAAARFKLANLGLFLPYSVICGFFTTIGILMWTLGFSVDTGMKVGQVVRSGDWAVISNALVHHVPSVIVGVVMHLAGRQHPVWVIFFMFATVFGSYVLLWLTGTSLAEATHPSIGSPWFFSVEDLVPDDDGTPLSWANYGPPLPLGAWLAAIQGEVVWEAAFAALPPVFSLAFLYLIRCSLHAAALKKNVPNVTRKAEDNEDSFLSQSSHHSRHCTRGDKKRKPPTLNFILEHGYGYAQLISALVGAITVSPAVAASLTMFHLGAESRAPQFGSCLLMLVFFATDFRLVQYIAKPTFSSLMILSGLEMCRTWFVGSFFKTKDKFEWMVAPVLVVLAFSVGMLPAIALGVAASTFIFVANFYRAGTVKFVGSGLSLRSPVERGYRETAFLDQHADLIQVLILQHYLFFGNAQSLSTYITTMFDDDDDVSCSVEDQNGYLLPPRPKYIVVDLAMTTGMDTSALDLFRENIEMCRTNRCTLLLAGLSPNLKSNFLYAGIKPEGGRTQFYFMEDLESALAEAEDGLITDMLHLEEMDKKEANIRRRKRSESNADDGFIYALQKIDEQHELNTAEELRDLGKYTSPREIKTGDVFVRDGSSHGLYFVETGLMRVQPTANISILNANSASAFPGTSPSLAFTDPTASLGHLNARGGTLGRQAAEWKEKQSRNKPTEQSFRLARIGQGWIIGSIETSNRMRRPGVHVAVTDCRLHHLSHDAIEEVEATNPLLAMRLYKLLSYLATKRQESTIKQLDQFVKIMKHPTPRLRGGKKELAQLTLRSI